MEAVNKIIIFAIISAFGASVAAIGANDIYKHVSKQKAKNESSSSKPPVSLVKELQGDHDPMRARLTSTKKNLDDQELAEAQAEKDSVDPLVKKPQSTLDKIISAITE